MTYIKAKTKQEVFNAAVTRLYDGTGQCVNYYGRCMYLDTETGNNCVVGIFIPDERIAECEFKSVSGIAESLLYDGVLEFQFISLLTSLQNAHDEPDNWTGTAFTNSEILRKIAKNQNLKMPEELCQ